MDFLCTSPFQSCFGYEKVSSPEPSRACNEVQLPADVVLMITEHLDFQDTYNLCRAAKQFKRALYDNNSVWVRYPELLWKGTVPRQYNTSTEGLRRCLALVSYCKNGLGHKSFSWYTDMGALDRMLYWTTREGFIEVVRAFISSYFPGPVSRYTEITQATEYTTSAAKVMQTAYAFGHKDIMRLISPYLTMKDKAVWFNKQLTNN